MIMIIIIMIIDLVFVKDKKCNVFVIGIILLDFIRYNDE